MMSQPPFLVLRRSVRLYYICSRSGRELAWCHGLVVFTVFFFISLSCCCHFSWGLINVRAPPLPTQIGIYVVRAGGVSTEDVDVFSPAGGVDFDWQCLEGALVLLGAAGRCQHCFATVEEVRIRYTVFWLIFIFRRRRRSAYFFHFNFRPI